MDDRKINIRGITISEANEMGGRCQTAATGMEGIEDEGGGMRSLKTGSSDQPIRYGYLCDIVVKVIDM